MKKTGRILGALFLAVTLFGSLSFGALFDKSEYAARRLKLMQAIPDGAAIILGAQTQVGYRDFFQSNDFVYLSGVEIPNAILIVDGIKKKSVLFFTITERAARNEGIELDVVRNPKDVSGMEKVLPVEQFSSYLAGLSLQVKTLYTPFKPEEFIRESSTSKFTTLTGNLTLNGWDGRLTRELQFVKHLRDRFPQVQVKDCSDMIWELRTIKSSAEMGVIRKAAKVAVKAYTEMMKATRVGMHEYELAALFEYYCKKEGAQDLSYYVIISSGENHPYVHYYKHDRVLKDGDFIVVDCGPEIGYYTVDISISYPANGKFTPRQREIYEAALALHKANMSFYKPGLTLTELTKRVNEALTRQGFDLSKGIFKTENMRPWFGHYVGMAVHDVGVRPGGNPEGPLKPGMVFANEPYAVFPDENLGVRVEDTVLVTENGCEILTAGIPREIQEIEVLMKQAGVIQVLKKAGLY